jgi:NAD(P) transhydrogenase subunit alpha
MHMIQSLNPAVLMASLYVFVLAAFLGYQLISRVPPLLHTPLMSATNAISGISLIGSLVIAGMNKVDFHALAGGGAAAKPSIATLLGFIAVVTATTNVVGGFGITDRMLKMFQQRKGAKGGKQ